MKILSPYETSCVNVYWSNRQRFTSQKTPCVQEVYGKNSDSGIKVKEGVN
jgi:hypothetical protein